MYTFSAQRHITVFRRMYSDAHEANSRFGPIANFPRYICDVCASVSVCWDVLDTYNPLTIRLLAGVGRWFHWPILHFPHFSIIFEIRRKEKGIFSKCTAVQCREAWKFDITRTSWASFAHEVLAMSKCFIFQSLNMQTHLESVHCEINILSHS